MNETTNNNASTTTSAKRVAKKSKPKKEIKLSKPQVFILRVLKAAKPGGMYGRNLIAERAAKLGASTSKGRLSDEAGNYGRLVKAGFIKADEVQETPGEGRAELCYAITAPGRKALENHSSK